MRRSRARRLLTELGARITDLVEADEIVLVMKDGRGGVVVTPIPAEHMREIAALSARLASAPPDDSGYL